MASYAVAFRSVNFSRDPTGARGPAGGTDCCAEPFSPRFADGGPRKPCISAPELFGSFHGQRIGLPGLHQYQTAGEIQWIAAQGPAGRGVVITRAHVVETGLRVVLAPGKSERIRQCRTGLLPAERIVTVAAYGICQCIRQRQDRADRVDLIEICLALAPCVYLAVMTQPVGREGLIKNSKRRAAATPGLPKHLHVPPPGAEKSELITRPFPLVR